MLKWKNAWKTCEICLFTKFFKNQSRTYFIIVSWFTQKLVYPLWRGKFQDKWLPVSKNSVRYNESLL